MTEPIVLGRGPIDAKFWVIGEAPGQEEMETGKPFVGPSGRFLSQKFRFCGVDEEDIRIENLIGIKPPRNDFTTFENDPEKLKLLLASVEALKIRIRAGKPNLILCLGAKPLKYLLGKDGITKWRGHLIQPEDLPCKAMATYHPSACLKQRYVDMDDNPGQYEALFQADIQKAVDESQYKELKYAEYTLKVRPTFTEVMDFFEGVKTSATYLSYDVETIQARLIDCIGLSYSPDLAICIPLYLLGGSRPVPYWTMPERVAIYKELKGALESNLAKIAQNSQYDNLILAEYYKIYVQGIFVDTMVLAHDLYSGLPKDLGTLISLYTRLPYMKFLLKSTIREDRWTYNAMDALANVHVFLGEYKEAQELGIWNHYRRIPNSVLLPLNEMQRIGVLIDEPLRKKALQYEELFMETVLHILDEVFPKKVSPKEFPHKFNPASVPNKKWLFLSKFKCRKQYKKGGITLDKNALEIYMKDQREPVRLFAEAIRRFRLSQTMRGKLAATLRNGRSHTAYSACGTDTGRISSSESIFGGTNLQNLQKGVQRKMYLPG